MVTEKERIIQDLRNQVKDWQSKFESGNSDWKKMMMQKEQELEEEIRRLNNKHNEDVKVKDKV